MLAPRAPCVAYRGSSASSGSPITAVNRRNTESWLAAMSTEPPSSGRVHIGRCDVRQDRAGPLPLVAGDLPLGHQALHHRQHGLVDGRVDHLAAPGPLPFLQRRQRADARVRGGERVADRDACAGRWPVRLAQHVAQPAHRLADRAEPGPRRVRAGLAEAGDAGEHDPRVDPGQHVVAEVPAFQRAGAEVLDQHVADRDQPADRLLALGPCGGRGRRTSCCGRPPATTATARAASPGPTGASGRRHRAARS